MAEINRDIKYLNRDFSDFRSRLIEYTKTYFPNTYQDFSPSSPGMNPDALHAKVPPTRASFRLVGSTG